MKKRASLFIIFGAALTLSAASIASGSPGLPARQSSSSSPAASSSTTTKKRKTSSSSRSRRRSRAHAQAAPTPDRIKEIQAALAKDGSYAGTPTGKWDAATIDAMKKFQDKNGIAPTGKIDALSLNKLGLGSETAGKGAPGPAVSPTPSVATVAAPTTTPASAPVSTPAPAVAAPADSSSPPAPADPPTK